MPSMVLTGWMLWNDSYYINKIEDKTLTYGDCLGYLLLVLLPGINTCIALLGIALQVTELLNTKVFR